MQVFGYIVESIEYSCWHWDRYVEVSYSIFRVLKSLDRCFVWITHTVVLYCGSVFGTTIIFVRTSQGQELLVEMQFVGTDPTDDKPEQWQTLQG